MIRAFFFSVASLTVLAACAPAETAAPAPAAVPAAAPVTVSAASVAPASDQTAYTLSWQSAPSGAPMRIEASPDPDFAPGAGDVIGAGVTTGALSWTAPAGAPRQYFLIIPEAGPPVRVASRLLPLEGGRNFRDLGGYATEDQRRVKWGQLYRSGVMSGLTPEDYTYLSELGIQVVCDLRTAQERTADPTVWAAGPVDYVTFPDPAAADSMGFMKVLQAPDVTPDAVREAMAQGYAQIAADQTPAYREMFARLARGETPLAFNCSAGKDRTGIGAALILLALGVSEETVVADYALSDTFVDYMAELAQQPEAAAGSPYAFLAALPPEVVMPLMKSDPYYLETVLAQIRAEHGSVLTYIQTELGVSDAMLEALRAGLLEG